MSSIIDFLIGLSEMGPSPRNISNYPHEFDTMITHFSSLMAFLA